MSTTTGIEWTDTTWNPVTGCTKVSPGCDHCYAEKITERFHGKGAFADVKLHPDRRDAPLRWRKPRRVFVNSMSDLFHDQVPDEFIAHLWAVMAQTPAHTYQILTKRHGRMRSLLGTAAFKLTVLAQARDIDPYRRSPMWPLNNVWLGVSVEDQKHAELRIPALLDTPAVVRFLSCEPLLGPVDLTRAVWTRGDQRGHGLTASFVHAGGCCERQFHGINWCIAGGESGPGARPCDPDWIGSLLRQCQAADVAVFVKQLGGVWARQHGTDPKGGDWTHWPQQLRVRQFPTVPSRDAELDSEGTTR